MERMLQISSKYLSLYGITILFWPAASGARRGIAIARAPGCVAWLVHTLSANAYWFDFLSEVVLSFGQLQKLVFIVPVLT